jgi:hypothetical protein
MSSLTARYYLCLKKSTNDYVGKQSCPISYLDPDKEFRYKLNIKGKLIKQLLWH